MLTRSDRLLILTYHRVVPNDGLGDPDEVDESQFRLHADTFSRFFNVLPLSEAVSRLKEHRLPGRSMAITFDDGYRDNVTAALPILNEYDLKATFFIATGFLDGGIMWNDIVIEAVKRFEGDRIELEDLGLGTLWVRSAAERVAAYKHLISQLKYREPQARAADCRAISDRLGVSVPDNLMMRSPDLSVLRDAGMEIGAHTRSHPILAVAGDEDARSEIAGSKEDIEKILGEEITAFAYPNGRPGKDFDIRHVEMVRDAGFDIAVTTASGCVRSGADALQIGRVSVWHRSRAKLLMRMLRNYLLAEPPPI